MLVGENILLRSLLDFDIDFLYSIENDKSLWKFGSENTYFDRFTLENYIRNAQQDIKKSKQFRFVIQHKDIPIGFIDLFDYSKSSAGVGIIIIDKYQNMGFGTESLSLLINYSRDVLKLTELFCNIKEDNAKSISLFTSFGFKKINSMDNVIHYKLKI